MPSTLTKLVLFVSSFSPLLLVFALLDSWGRGLPTRICIALAVLSWIALWLVLRVASRLSRVPVRAAIAKRRDSELLAYIVTYFVPFLTVPADSLRKGLALGIFVALIAIFYMQGEMYHWNPILGLCGYRVIEVGTSQQQTFSLITRRRYIPSGMELYLISLSNNVYWEPR